MGVRGTLLFFCDHCGNAIKPDDETVRCGCVQHEDSLSDFWCSARCREQAAHDWSHDG